MYHDTYRISTNLTVSMLTNHIPIILCPCYLLHMDILLVVLLEYYVHNLYYRFLIKYIDKLTEGNKQANILVPLCGTSVDLKWSVSEKEYDDVH